MGGAKKNKKKKNKTKIKTNTVVCFIINTIDLPLDCVLS